MNFFLFLNIKKWSYCPCSRKKKEFRFTKTEAEKKKSQLPSSAWNDLSEPSNLSAIGWSCPKTSPEAS